MRERHLGWCGNKEAMKSVIVTGASGFVGQWLVKELLKENIKVYAIVRNETKLEKLADNHFPILCPMEKLDELNGTLANEGIDTFYHLAWEGSTGEKRADYNIQLKNVEYSCKAMEVAKNLGCKRFLAAGTITEQIVDDAIHMETVSPNLMYGVCKKMTHNILLTLSKKLDIEFVWMQFSNIFGPGNNTGNLISYTLSAINKNENTAYSSALQPYDFIYIKDLVRAVYLLGKSELKNDVYFIGSGNSRILKEYLLAIPKALGLSIEMGIGKRAEDGLVYLPEWFLIDDLKNDTGFEAGYSFEEAVRETYESFK